MLGPSYEIGVDSNGLFVLDRPRGRLVYRAHRIRHRAADGGAWLADLDHPDRDEHWVATTIAGGASQLLTRPRTYRPEDFEYAVAALTVVFEASVEIGRPVVWT